MECWDGESPAFKGKPKWMYVDADGDRLVGFGWFPEDDRVMVDGARTAGNAWRSFIFTDIRTTGLNRLPTPKNIVLTSNAPLDHSDGDAVLSDNYVRPDQIGTISVLLFLAKNLRESSPEPEDYEIQDRPPVMIDEQKKKNAEHCVS